MTDRYRIFGAELSPYSVKVRSYFRFKGIPHQWLLRNPSNVAEYRKYAKLPLIPLVITPGDEGLQDSTPILERLEAERPEPSIYPADPVLRFVSDLIEEYADEWGNKGMFHYRWWREVDRRSAALRIAGMMLGPDAATAELEQAADSVIERMVPRLSFVGSNQDNQALIEGSFVRQIEILDRHLRVRRYLLGGRPSLADFGLWGQIYNAWTDPTAGGVIRDRGPSVVPWIERMLEPKVESEFETWDDLAPTLEPLLRDEIAGLFLPWSTANARAIEAGDDELEVELEGGTFRQRPQKYHARSLAALGAKYRAVAADPVLGGVLESTGCLEWLQG